MVNTELSARIRDIVADELKAARDRVRGDINFKNGDPRDAAKSVKRVVYKKILGGNINILDRKSEGAPNSYEPQRKLRPGQRGGNRMIRSQRTHDIMHSSNRGFILRFVNSGTNPRYANGRNVTGSNKNMRNFYRLHEQGDWYRGSIAPHPFFKNTAGPELDHALRNLVSLIDQEFDKLFK